MLFKVVLTDVYIIIIIIYSGVNISGGGDGGGCGRCHFF
jgi:hypothetical protein